MGAAPPSLDSSRVVAGLRCPGRSHSRVCRCATVICPPDNTWAGWGGRVMSAFDLLPTFGRPDVSSSVSSLPTLQSTSISLYSSEIRPLSIVTPIKVGHPASSKCFTCSLPIVGFFKKIHTHAYNKNNER